MEAKYVKCDDYSETREVMVENKTATINGDN